MIFAGAYESIYDDATESLTTKYMNGTMAIEPPAERRRLTNWLKLTGARMHNLKKIDVQVPLNAITVVSGVSGSGKTSLIKGILYPALRRELGEGTLTSPGSVYQPGGRYEADHPGRDGQPESDRQEQPL